MRKMMLQFVAALLGWSALTAPTAATTYSIDASIGATPFAVQGLAPTNWSISGYISPVYTAQPGDTFDFGTLIEFSTLMNGWPPHVHAAVQANYQVSFDGSLTPLSFQTSGTIVGGCDDLPGNNTCLGYTPPPPVEKPLMFTLPAGATEIQIGWTLPSSYIAPVPEPSTWAMLLIGFAGIAFAAYRRKHNGASAVKALSTLPLWSRLSPSSA